MYNNVKSRHVKSSHIIMVILTCIIYTSFFAKEVCLCSFKRDRNVFKCIAFPTLLDAPLS